MLDCMRGARRDSWCSCCGCGKSQGLGRRKGIVLLVECQPVLLSHIPGLISYSRWWQAFVDRKRTSYCVLGVLHSPSVVPCK